MAKPKKVGPTQQERALADVSGQQWADYVERFRPAEAALIRKAEFTAGEKAQVKGEVAGDTAAAFAGLARDTVAKGGAAGANVNYGKTKLSLAANANAAGTAKGVGQALAVAGGEVDSSMQKLGITAMGRGIAHEATANLSRGAQRATSLAIAASQAKFERNQALVEGVATIAGAATKKYQLRKEHRAFSDNLLIDTSTLPRPKATQREVGGIIDPFQPGGPSYA